jgi:hypothetical protein
MVQRMSLKLSRLLDSHLCRELVLLLCLFSARDSQIMINNIRLMQLMQHSTRAAAAALELSSRDPASHAPLSTQPSARRHSPRSMNRCCKRLLY